MSEDGGPDLGLLVRQLRQVLAEFGSMRADMSVLTAIVMRQDNTLSALLTEIRAMHPQDGSAIVHYQQQINQPGSGQPATAAPKEACG